MLEKELHKLTFHKHEISLAFISILHLTLNTHPDSVLISFWRMWASWWFGGRHREVIDRYKIWARMLGDPRTHQSEPRWQVLVA